MAYPEEIEETKSIIQLASPAKLENEMPPPNYKIGNVNVPPREKGPLQSVAEAAGANVVGKAGEAALFGVPAAGQTIGTGGIWGKMAPAIAKGATAMGPWGWALAAGLGLAALKNKGGEIGPLGAQHKQSGGDVRYAGEGAYSFPIGPEDRWLQPKGWREFEEYMEAQALGRYGDQQFDPPWVVWDDYPAPSDFNKGGNVQHKEHGGMMTGPLSNNKSVKMEKKETIEYKN